MEIVTKLNTGKCNMELNITMYNAHRQRHVYTVQWTGTSHSNKNSKQLNETCRQTMEKHHSSDIGLKDLKKKKAEEADNPNDGR